MSGAGTLVVCFGFVLVLFGAGVLGVLAVVLARLHELNVRLTDTRLMLFTLIQDLHFMHRLTMSSFPDVLERVAQPDTEQEGRHGRGETR